MSITSGALGATGPALKFVPVTLRAHTGSCTQNNPAMTQLRRFFEGLLMLPPRMKSSRGVFVANGTLWPSVAAGAQ